jgi:hypothetical protein
MRVLLFGFFAVFVYGRGGYVVALQTTKRYCTRPLRRQR